IPSSSAAICRMAIRKPCPRSTLPQNTVTVPSPFTAKKPSTSFGSRMRGELPPSSAKRSSPRPLNAKAMVSAPPLRTARRDTRGGLMGTVISASRTRRRHDGSDNSDVSAAAAQIPIERGANFVFGGLGCLGEQRNGTHDHTARAVAALRHLIFNEGGLDRVRCGARAKAFERCYRPIAHVRYGRLAGSGSPSFDQNRAGAALSQPASELGGSQPKAAQDVE